MAFKEVVLDPAGAGPPDPIVVPVPAVMRCAVVRLTTPEMVPLGVAVRENTMGESARPGLSACTISSPAFRPKV